MDSKIKKALSNNNLITNLIKQLDEELFQEGHNLDAEALIMRFAEAIDSNYDNIYNTILDDLENEI